MLIVNSSLQEVSPRRGSCRDEAADEGSGWRLLIYAATTSEWTRTGAINAQGLGYRKVAMEQATKVQQICSWREL